MLLLGEAFSLEIHRSSKSRCDAASTLERVRPYFQPIMHVALVLGPSDDPRSFNKFSRSFQSDIWVLIPLTVRLSWTVEARLSTFSKRPSSFFDNYLLSGAFFGVPFGAATTPASRGSVVSTDGKL